MKWAIAQANGRADRLYKLLTLRSGDFASGHPQVRPDVPVLWVDHGYNRPATYQHAEQLKKLFKLQIRRLSPRMTAAHYDAAFRCAYPEATPENEVRIKEFGTAMKLEPFKRGMEKELAPTVWLTALRQVQNPNRT